METKPERKATLLPNPLYKVTWVSKPRNFPVYLVFKNNYVKATRKFHAEELIVMERTSGTCQCISGCPALLWKEVKK